VGALGCPAGAGGPTELPGLRGRVDHRSLLTAARGRRPPTQAGHGLCVDKQGGSPVTAYPPLVVGCPLRTAGLLPAGRRRCSGTVPRTDPRQGPSALPPARGL